MFDIARQFVHAQVADRNSKVVAGDFFQFVRFIENDRSAIWKNTGVRRAVGFELDGEVGEEQVMVDDDNVAFRRAPPHFRDEAALPLFAFLAEAGVGAALVQFRLVADNARKARAQFMSVHLVNTFFLLASLALTAYWLSGGGRVDSRNRRGLATRFGIGAAAILLAGVSGAVAALGDTLYPSGNLAQAFGADVSATSHLLLRLRLLHPAITMSVAVALVVTGVRFGYDGRGLSRRLGFAVAGVAALQVLAGFTNVLLLAPVWMQMAHLVIADVLWISFVLLGGVSLRAPGDLVSARP